MLERPELCILKIPLSSTNASLLILENPSALLVFTVQELITIYRLTPTSGSTVEVRNEEFDK